ncbi:MAG: radical SAM/SPASM family putative metalloenzyme maturase [Gammaproteobacteria bacterium]
MNESLFSDTPTEERESPGLKDKIEVTGSAVSEFNGPDLKKIFVEPTTRCNFECKFCVRQASGSGIEIGDLTLENFQALLPATPDLEAMVFAGIGEPLLHPQIDKLVYLAKQHLPKDAWVGIQTNGSLLDQTLAEKLIDAGLDRICVSMDTEKPETFQDIRPGGKVSDVINAFSVLNSAKSACGDTHLKLGIEFVLVKNNLMDLPGVLAWAVKNGAEFVLVTQMLPYDASSEADVLYSANMDISREFYDRWHAEAVKRDIDLKSIIKLRWSFGTTLKEQELVDFVSQMEEEAYSRFMPFHFEKLVSEDTTILERVEQVFSDARQFAEETGLELSLPAIFPAYDRKCNFIEDGSAFVSWQGTVHPCYFLWHKYVCYVGGFKKNISLKTVGDLSEQNITEIWNNKTFAEFRNAVLKYDFSYCANCRIGPCTMIESETFEYDCHATEVPCGHCPWCLDLLQCLR